MASVDKFTSIAVSNMLRHNSREIENSSNPDIDPERSHLNYSFPLDHGGLTDYQYYKKIVGENYLYGRGTVREKDSITACGWVITLPQELSGFPEKEKTFFGGVLDFISHRYGRENIISNHVHYDEAGQPHIHVIFSPVTNLDHAQVQLKTVKTKTAVKLDSGRYEYSYRYLTDALGNRIPVKNYARMTDYYDKKISCAEVINRAELRHFHSDLQSFLTEKGIEGTVVNGSTGGANMSVKSMKEFTKATGLTVAEAKALKSENVQLKEGIVKIETEATAATVAAKKGDATIDQLWDELSKKDAVISEKDQQISSLTNTIAEKDMELESMNDKYSRSQQKVAELESQIENGKSHSPTWGNVEGWGKTQGWGKDFSYDTYELDKTVD